MFVRLWGQIVIILVGLALVAAPAAALTVGGDVSSQKWTWYDEGGAPLNEREHTKTTLTLGLGLGDRVAGSLSAGFSSVLSSVDAGVDVALFHVGPAELNGIVRYHGWTIETDHTYSVRGLGYGVDINLALVGRELGFAYVINPAMQIQAGNKLWDAQGSKWAARFSPLGLGPLRLVVGYTHEEYEATSPTDDDGRWVNRGLLVGAVVEL